MRGITNRKEGSGGISGENYGQDCAQNQEVHGQYEVERDRPGQEVKQAIDAAKTKEVAGVHSC